MPSVALAQVVEPPATGPITFPVTFDTDLIMWSALVAQIMPLLIARLVKTDWSSDAKIVTAIVACLVVSFVTAFLLGRLDPANVITSALIVFTLTSVMFRQVWQRSETVARLEAT